MERFFAVTYAPGARWNASVPLEEQADWQAHTAFVDTLYADGFVVLVGPLEGTQTALMIVRARDIDQVRARLADDPWLQNEVRQISQAAPWTVRLGALG